MKQTTIIVVISFIISAYTSYAQTNGVTGIFYVPTNEPTIPLIRDKPDTIRINYGNSFGECAGYCRTEVDIHSWGIDKTRSGLGLKSKTQITISESEYKSLLASIDYKKFLQLKETIGCPDCDDGGAEWVEIHYGTYRKAVTFQYGATIESINDLLIKMRSLPNQ